MKISVVVDLSSYGVIFSVWISRNKKIIPKIYFYTIQMVWNGRPSWVRALRGRVGLWFVGLSETGFWPLTSRRRTRANRFKPVFWNFPAGHLPRTNSSVETCSIFIWILSFKVFKKIYSFYKIFGNLSEISVALLSAAILASSGFTEKCAPAFQN